MSQREECFEKVASGLNWEVEDRTPSEERESFGPDMLNTFSVVVVERARRKWRL